MNKKNRIDGLAVVLFYLFCSDFVFLVALPQMNQENCQKEWTLHEQEFIPYEKQNDAGDWAFDRDAYCKEIRTLYLGEALFLFIISPVVFIMYIAKSISDNISFGLNVRLS